MAFSKMLSLIVLLWILPSINAGGEEDHFQTFAVPKMVQNLVDKIQQPKLVYVNRYTSIVTDPPYVVVLQKTNNCAYILDTSGFLLQYVEDHSIGRLLSDFMNGRILTLDRQSEISIHKTPSDIDMLSIDVSLCYGYNLTLADTNNGPSIEAVRYDRCSGSTLTSYIQGKPSEFRHLKGISLRRVGITELTVEDLMHYPELQSLYVESVTIKHMENGLLCYNLNITILLYSNSFGFLRVFPRQIFNCAMPLKLEYLHLEDHNIASLPAHAFGSAAEQLRVLYLKNIGLKGIHKDAFTGLMNLQHVYILNNNLFHISGAMIPPSTRLKVISYVNNRLNRNLNLTTMHIARKSHLQMFEWQMPHISVVEGSFCSNQSNSDLEIIFLTGISSGQSNSKLETMHFRGNNSMGETLPANVFAHCISLKLLSIKHTGLAYLPDRLFSANVSQLETLLLASNKLNSNASWSDVLKPLHKLKHLNLSANMLTLWTHNLSSLWSLEMLDLSHNAITEISHMAFMNMTKLKFLSLENNNIAFLAPEVQHEFAHISLLNLGSNSIHKLNMMNETMLSDTIIVDISSNNLTQLDMPLERKCSQPCGKISLFGDHNKLSRFVLPCSNTQQYATVSLTNNNLTEVNSVFPNVSAQQCSIETLNVSGNYFKAWLIGRQTTQYQYEVNRIPQTHNITTLDMTHCGIEVIDPLVFRIFNIQFLDLTENAIHTLPAIDKYISSPSALVAQFNPIMCSCNMTWLKRYLNKEASDREKEIHVTHCMEPVWNKSMDIVTVPNFMFMCKTQCPKPIHQQCDKADMCYTVDSVDSVDERLDAVVCLSSNSNSKLSSAFITVSYQLYISGFNLATLKLPYVKPHSLTHLNLTLCNISVIPETTFIKTTRLGLLVLADNSIQTIPRATFHPLVLLKYLDLSNNQLLSFDTEMIFPLSLLNTLFLHDNKLKQLFWETLGRFKMLDNLSLHDNPWICDCSDTFGPWIVEQQPKDILLNPGNITCDGTDISVMYSNVSCNTHTLIHVHHGSKAATLVSSVLALLLGVTLFVCTLIYKYRHTLSVLAFIYIPRCTKRRTENDDVRGVFAIYDHRERGALVWIKDNLIPFIECACPLICMDRDFMPGVDMADEIEHAVKHTNCAIVLLSRRFMQNEWSCCMFQAAFSEVRERKRLYKIILILTPDVTVNMLTTDENCPQDLRVMLRTQRLVYMSKKFYYETLAYLLPDSCRSTRQIMTVTGEDITTTFSEQQFTQNMLKWCQTNAP